MTWRRINWASGEHDALIVSMAIRGRSARDAARVLSRELGRTVTVAQVHGRAARMPGGPVVFRPNPERISARLSLALRASYANGRSKPKGGRPGREAP